MSHRPNQEENWALWEEYNPRTGNWLSDTKDILLRFFQDFFYQMPSGEQPSLFHFEPSGADDYGTSVKETEIIITDAGSVNTESVEKRPILVISRGPFAYGNTSMDQLLSVRGSDDKKTFTDLITGSFSIHCIAREGLEAERLASIVARAVRVYRRELQKAGFFQIGSLVNISSETPAGSFVSGDSAPDFIDVPVTIPIYYQDSWTRTPEAEVLAKIKFTAYSMLRDLSGELLDPESLDDDGNPDAESESVTMTAWTVT